MALELLANEDRVITITVPVGSLWVPGIPSYTDLKSTKCKANSKWIILVANWTMSGCTFPGMILFAGGGGSINGTRVKCKCEGTSPLAENDQGTCNGSFLMSLGPPPVYVYCNCAFKVVSAGQTKVKGT